MSRKLTPRQQRFVEEYLIDCNASAAALRAGYKHKDVGRQNLTLSHVQEAIAALQGARAEKVEVKAAEVLRELLLVARSDIGQVLDFSGTDPRLKPVNEISEYARRSLSAVKVRRFTEGAGDDAREVEVTEFKLWDKLSALDKLGKHLGLWKDNNLDLSLKLEIRLEDVAAADKDLEKWEHERISSNGVKLPQPSGNGS